MADYQRSLHVFNKSTAQSAAAERGPFKACISGGQAFIRRGDA
jgi:hypothetical protein